MVYNMVSGYQWWFDLSSLTATQRFLQAGAPASRLGAVAEIPRTGAGGLGAGGGLLLALKKGDIDRASLKGDIDMDMDVDLDIDV